MLWHTQLTMAFPFSTIELKDDTIIVVLGASGDLAKKKTVRVSPCGFNVHLRRLTRSPSSLHSSAWYVSSDNYRESAIDLI